MNTWDWFSAWVRFADKARAHLLSLDPQTDGDAIERWARRWYLASKRANTAWRRHCATHWAWADEPNWFSCPHVAVDMARAEPVR